MEAKLPGGDPKNSSRLEIGKAAIGCVSAVIVACISGTVGILTNWDKVQRVWSGVNLSQTLFQDEFSDVNSGWERFLDDAGNITDYSDGSYRIHVVDTETLLYTTPGKSFSNTVIKVTAQYAGGPQDNLFGVMCRFQDVDNHYELVISSDGYYGIGRYLQGEYSLLGYEELQHSEFIKLEGGTNQIQAECVKDRLVLLANGHKLIEVTDDELPQKGDIGLMAESFSEGGVDILFDHLTVRKP